MSKSYSTGSTFHPANNETKIREIIQQELYEFFSEIKVEIEAKIKKIDSNINDLKAKIDLMEEKADKHLCNTT